ncbi:NitT/TauT family transport system substrate-binding protein [Paenibacillus sp. UNC496MF]|uniref:ABC transporter substrate-binding protein n=1 Tax=Paenibacillus sp. UNC496MF TaxID=1502753 RepID=UPI0008EB3557|nr:ABC transporter substrate-binding protein [Paenibacillus sp. UNC496MF]SFI85933.1 NitT/TauT family transport system substrate-binding protein [Paenibacillus sp. UNC496MF]
MRIRTMLAVLFCISLLGLTAACGGKAADNVANSGADAAAAGADEASAAPDAPLKKLVIAEPLHSVGYLPLYIAQRDGYFKKHGLDVKVITAAGGTHVTAVVSGDAWGVIGGPESNAMANKKNDDPIISVVNVVNRANVYMMAKKGTAPKSDSPADLKAFLEDKKLIVGRHGGTPNLLSRYLLIQLGLDPDKDTQLLEPADSSAVVAMMQSGAGEVSNGAEPQVSDGMTKGVWDEPFYKFTSLGDYAYSVLSVKKSAIEKEPETVQGFVDAIVEVLQKVKDDRAYAAAQAKLEFPTMSEDGLKAAMDRAYEDELWSPDGQISEAALKNDMDVMQKTGIFTDPYTYDELVDMQFVDKANASN